MEIAGSLGDLGTLLPIALGMIIINGLAPTGLFLVIGLYYIFSGVYFGIPTSVQPMKVIGSYAIAAALTAPQIAASGLLIAFFLLFVGGTGLISIISRFVPKSTVRGVQLATGVLLMIQGIKIMIGTSAFQEVQQAAEPYLSLQNVGPIPFGIIIGVGFSILALLLLNNTKIPAGLFIVMVGFVLGLVFGTHEGFESLRFGINLPSLMPYGFPSYIDFTYVLLVLVLPQIPMTIGNAVMANADLSRQYFGAGAAKVTEKGLCISMGLVNIGSFLLGGIPLCHGAGGLAAHYRFGARTAGSNVIIGLFFVISALLLGPHILSIIYLLPMAVLGVLLLFAGGQLALTISDLVSKKDLFVAVIMLAITLTVNLGVAFIIGVILAYIVKQFKVEL